MFSPLRCPVGADLRHFRKDERRSLVWRAVIPGREAAMRKLQEMAAQSANEFQLKHLASDTLIATINTPPAKPEDSAGI
jgi:hypothetical protein